MKDWKTAEERNKQARETTALLGVVVGGEGGGGSTVTGHCQQLKDWKTADVRNEQEREAKNRSSGWYTARICMHSDLYRATLAEQSVYMSVCMISSHTSADSVCST